MAEPAQKRRPLDEFLAWNDGTAQRYELVVGEIVAMAPPARGHGALMAKLTGGLVNRLRPPCTADRRCRHRSTRAGGHPYYQADIAVTCTPQPADARHTAEPILIVEVLSPSTAERDRGRKLADYRRIEPVREILLISAQERWVELWRRDDGGWHVEDLIGEAEIRLETTDAVIPLATLYEGVLG